MKPSCAKVAMERVGSDPELQALHEAWETATSRLTGEATYTDPSWMAFATHCERLSWSDSNDAAMAADAKRRSTNLKRKRIKKREAAKRRRPVSQAIRDAIEAERDKRRDILIELHGHDKAPRYVSKMPLANCGFLANVWAAEEYLTRSRVSLTTANIAREIDGAPEPTRSRQNRVGDARRRINRLIADGHWGEFEAPVKPLPVTGAQYVSHNLTP